MHGSMKKFVTTHAWARWCTALPGAYEKVRDHSYAWASCGGLTNTIIMKISRPVRFKAGGSAGNTHWTRTRARWSRNSIVTL